MDRCVATVPDQGPLVSQVWPRSPQSSVNTSLAIIRIGRQRPLAFGDLLYLRVNPLGGFEIGAGKVGCALGLMGKGATGQCVGLLWLAPDGLVEIRDGAIIVGFV